MYLRSITLILTLAFSLSSYAELNLPKHDSVTYSSIYVDSFEPKKASDRWMVVYVHLRGVKVLGEKYLNGEVRFSYDSHFQGDRADLGLRFNSNGTGSLSKPITQGGFKIHRKKDGKSNQYVGGAKWGRAAQVQQYLRGAKKNSEQDYIMINWMLANADDIIHHAVTNVSMSSRAKNGWKRLGNFTRAAYGNVNNNLKVLDDANARMPKQVASSVNTSQLQNRIKTLTYQVSQLNKRIVELRDENSKLENKLASYNQEPRIGLASNYDLKISRTVGGVVGNLGILSFSLKDGKLIEQPSPFVTNYLPSRIVGTYNNNGDFEIDIIADFMKIGSIYNRKKLNIIGNFDAPDSIITSSNYSMGTNFSVKVDRKGAKAHVKSEYGCFNYIGKTYSKASSKGKCFGDSFPISINEYNQKSLSDSSSQTADKLVYLEQQRRELRADINKLETQVREISDLSQKRFNSLQDARSQLSKSSKLVYNATDEKANRIVELETQVKQLEANLEAVSTSKGRASTKLKNRNTELTLKVVQLQEQLAVGGSESALPFNYCLSTKLEHAYVIAENDRCLPPYVEVDANDLIEITSSLSITDIGTSHWVSATQWSKDDIVSIQKLLVAEGLSSSKPDGIFGPNTSKAVQKLVADKDYKVVSKQLYLTVNAHRGLINSAILNDLEQKISSQNAAISSTKIEDYERQLLSLKQRTKEDVAKKDSLIKSLEQQLSLLQASSNSESSTSNQKMSDLTGRISDLEKQLSKSADESTKKDTLIKSLEHELALLREDSSAQSGLSSQKLVKLEREITDLKKLAKAKQSEYELQIQKLNQLIANLNDQLAQSKRVSDKHASAVKSQEQEIKRLNSELTVAQEKIKKIRPTESSFMDTLSEEWRPHVSDMPLTERLFCDLYHNFNVKKAKAIQSNNQIQVNMVHRAFQEDLDSLIPGGELDQWIVKVLMVSQVKGGDAALIAELPCGVLVGSGTMTTKVSGTDELTWAATIPYDSRLFNEIAKVSIGDFVNVSGTFVQVKAFKSGQNETYYASNSIGKNPLVKELGLENDLYLMDVAYFMMLR